VDCQDHDLLGRHICVHDIVRGEWSFYAMRFLLGIAEAGFFPGVIFYLTLWYPSRHRSTRTAWFVAAIAVSGVIGNPTSGWILDTLSGAMKMAGWQWLFLAEGIPSIIVGFWVIYYLNSSIEEAKWLTGEEKVLLADNLVAEDKHKTEHKLIDAFTSGKVWVLCAIYFTLMIALNVIVFWLPTIVKAFGVKGYFGVGLTTAMPYGVAVIGMILLSHHSDKTGERRLHYVVSVTAGSHRSSFEWDFRAPSCSGFGFFVPGYSWGDWVHALVLAVTICVFGWDGCRSRHGHCEFGG